MSYDLIMELQQKNRELSASIKQLRASGTALAEAERDYKITLREAVLRLKEEKQPATLINLIVYGEKDVAEKRFKRNIAETVYLANQEAINSTKLQLRLLESQIQREWSNNAGSGI